MKGPFCGRAMRRGKTRSVDNWNAMGHSRAGIGPRLKEKEKRDPPEIF